MVSDKAMQKLKRMCLILDSLCRKHHVTLLCGRLNFSETEAKALIHNVSISPDNLTVLETSRPVDFGLSETVLERNVLVLSHLD